MISTQMTRLNEALDEIRKTDRVRASALFVLCFWMIVSHDDKAPREVRLLAELNDVAIAASLTHLAEFKYTTKELLDQAREIVNAATSKNDQA